MPGLGTAYVEIQLDRSKFDRSLKQLENDAVSMPLAVEDAFKNLGIKSSYQFDLMREKAELNYQRIKAAANVTANDIFRAEQAKDAQLARLREEQHGKQLSFIESVKENWLAASASIVAAWAAVNKAIGLMDEAAKAMRAESAFTIMAEAAGDSADRIIAAMKAATKETIDDSDMMQKAVKLMTLGFDPRQIEEFSKVVMTAATIAGTTAAEAFDQLGDAIANRTPKALIRLGAVTREQMEIVNKAMDAGASASDLMSLAVENLRLKQLMLQGTQNEATVALERFHAQVKNTGEELGKVFVVAVQKAWGFMQLLASGAYTVNAAFSTMVATMAEWAAWSAGKLGLEGQAQAMTEFARRWRETAAEFSKISATMAENAYGNMAGVADTPARATQEEIGRQKKLVQGLIDVLKARADQAKTVEALAARFKELQRMADQAAKDELKGIEEAERKRKEYTDTVTRNTYESITKQRAIIEEAQKYGIQFTLDEAKRLADEMEKLEKAAEERRDAADQLRRDQDAQRIKDMERILELQKEYNDALKEEYEAQFKLLFDIANQVGGETGKGLGMAASGLKGVFDAYGEDNPWSKKLADAEKYYNAVRDLNLQGMADDEDVRTAFLARQEAQHDASLRRMTGLSSAAAQVGAGAMLSIYEATGRKQKEYFQAYKAFQLASAMIAGIDAVIQSYDWGTKTGGPILGAVMAAIASAFVGVQIGAIASMQPSGTSSAPSPGSVGGYTYVQPTEPSYQQVEGPRPMAVNVHVYGSYIGDKDTFAREISDSLRKAWEDGA